MSDLVIRPAQVADVPALARLHVESWRQTFRGQFADAVLDDPNAIPRREHSALLDAVIEPTAPAGLWVVDPSPRAQAFYRKHDFEPDGRQRVDDGVRVIRMTRQPH